MVVCAHLPDTGWKGTPSAPPTMLLYPCSLLLPPPIATRTIYIAKKKYTHRKGYQVFWGGGALVHMDVYVLATGGCPLLAPMTRLTGSPYTTAAAPLRKRRRQRRLARATASGIVSPPLV